MDRLFRYNSPLFELLVCLCKFVAPLGFMFLVLGVQAKTLNVMYRAPDSSNDKRQDYVVDVIKLSLTKSLRQDETLEFAPIPPMNSERARFALSTNHYPNLVLELSYRDDMDELKSVDYVPFPIELGALSYRTCFVSPNFAISGKLIESTADLQKLTFGVGVGWPDTIIFKDNRFNVIELSHYDNIFKMLSGNRFDLFCRGASEVLNEYLTFNPIYKLHHDTSFTLYYQLPRFLFVHKDNKELKTRLAMGLKRAYEDGSLVELWKSRFASSVKFSNIKNRKVLTIENKRIKNIDKSWEQYLLPIDAYY